jgi:glutamate dehydrogenase (NAD(P)+)
MWYQGSKLNSSLNESKSTMNKIEKTQPVVHEFVERTVGLHAYIVIDSLRNGQSCGGLRISDDLTLEEIKTLAASMTLKYCFLQRNMGGAKAGIILPNNSTSEHRTQVLEAFGRHAAFLLKNKTYIPWTDLGSSGDDIAKIMNSAGCDFHGISDSSYFTALTVVSAIKAACEMQNKDLSGCSVIIEGFGSVGMHAASELAKWGATLVGISTAKGALYDTNGLDIKTLIELQKTYKDDVVHHYGKEYLETKERLLEMDTDILLPCAKTWSINTTNMKNIKAKIIAPGANAPMTKEAEAYLHQQGVLCLPDFLCNLGGIFGTSLYDNRNPIPTVHRFIMNEFGALIKDILRRSAQKNLHPSEVAEAIAEKNCITNHQRMFSQFWKRKYIIQWLARTSVVQQAMPKLQAWASLQNQQRILTENRKYLQD